MKKNDIALIILIISVSLVATYFLAKAILGEPQNNTVKAEVVEPISADLTQPSSDIFNKNAINPTVDIEIGNSANQQPFGN
ncbi:MAG: hypothetical protein PVI21_04290 [Candidatus Woesebacteria bacterium]|jgi:hypothetical protein